MTGQGQLAAEPGQELNQESACILGKFLNYVTKSTGIRKMLIFYILPNEAYSLSRQF